MDFLRKLFAKKCLHDWETINEHCFVGGYDVSDDAYDWANDQAMKHPWVYKTNGGEFVAKEQICLKCGERRGETEKEMRSQLCIYKEEEERRSERKRRAKKLVAD